MILATVFFVFKAHDRCRYSTIFFVFYRKQQQTNKPKCAMSKNVLRISQSFNYYLLFPQTNEKKRKKNQNVLSFIVGQQCQDKRDDKREDEKEKKEKWDLF